MKITPIAKGHDIVIASHGEICKAFVSLQFYGRNNTIIGDENVILLLRRMLGLA